MAEESLRRGLRAVIERDPSGSNGSLGVRALGPDPALFWAECGWSYICLQAVVASTLSSTKHVAAILAFLALASGCANGAASDDSVASDGEGTSDALVASAVTVADPAATASAEVLADRVRLPLAVADRYRALAPGSIFVGARGAPSGKNPDGFLRRVSSLVVDGDALVVMTTSATLTDAIVHGVLRTSSGGSGLAFDDHGASEQSLTPRTRKELSGITVDFANEALFDGEDAIDVGGKKARFVESIRLERAVLTAKPVVDIDLRIRDGKVSRFVAKVEGNLDTSVSAVATVTGEGDIDEQTLAELRTRKHDVKRVVYQSPRVALPTIAVGGVPVSPSVQFTVTLRCSLAFGGPLVAHAGVEAKSYVRLGAVYDGAAGAWAAPIKSDFDIKPSFTLDRAGDVEARCAIEADAELFAYGTSGVTMSVAPYVDFSVKPEAAAHRFVVGAGATGVMHGRADAFGLAPEALTRPVAEWTSPAILEGVAP
jgi:hypothetical protein